MHLRVFDKDLNLLQEKDLLANINGAAFPRRYSGLGASQLYADGYYCVFAQSPTGDKRYFERGARQIFVIRFDDNFNFVDSKAILTDTNNDNYWCTGSWYEDGLYYISYTYRKPGEGTVLGPGIPEKLGSFSADQGNIRLSIFDKDFNELLILQK